jgi:hypothetical protein
MRRPRSRRQGAGQRLRTTRSLERPTRLPSEALQDGAVLFDDLSEAGLEVTVLPTLRDALVDRDAHGLGNGHVVDSRDRLKLGALSLRDDMDRSR